MKNHNVFGYGLVSVVIAVAVVVLIQLAQIETVQAGTAAGDLGRGAVLWSQNCARCHNMRDPKEFRDDLWKPIVTHMRIRAGLTGQDARDILVFLQASN
ncbi:hypothetical protein [Sulfuriflexus mobilis]|uniref:hypothetical protein n=1 Tax=Sulfuriflexus mobilis TaxID=1811807 RepID=UPI0018D561A1|nr:hypothetical protein [Sulfuriflexus mobilis]